MKWGEFIYLRHNILRHIILLIDYIDDQFIVII